MIGERGGSSATLEQGVELIEIHKAELRAAVRADILDHLATHSEWHANDLRVDVTGHANVVGATVNGLSKSGLIEKTGEWRPATAPASHGRESRVWRLRRGGDGRTHPQSRASVGQPAVISPTGEPGGSRLDETAVAPTLFQLDPDPPPAPGHVDLDQREAA